MRSGEWLRDQWIARVVYGLRDGPWQPRLGLLTRRALGQLDADGLVGHRDVVELRDGHVSGVAVAVEIPRREWRLTR